MKYYKQLDALRLYAVLWVVVGHLPLFSLHTSVKTFFSFIPGVQIFFSISGFLITGIVLNGNTSSRWNFIKSFYARRFLRIFPIYYLVIAALFIVNVEHYRSTWFFSDLAYVSNFKIGLLGGFEFNPITPHFWSLAVEEQFYLFWPGLLLVFPGKTKAYFLSVFFFFLGAYLMIFNGSFLVLRTIGCLSYLGSGCILAIAFHYNLNFVIKKNHLLMVVLLVFLFLIICISILKVELPKGIINALSIIIIPLIVLKFVIGFRNKIIRSVMENKVIIYLGKISYGIYVYHFIAVYPILLIKKAIGMNLIMNDGFESFLKISLTILLSVLSWEFFEKPFIKMKNKFEYNSKN